MFFTKLKHDDYTISEPVPGISTHNTSKYQFHITILKLTKMATYKACILKNMVTFKGHSEACLASALLCTFFSCKKQMILAIISLLLIDLFTVPFSKNETSSDKNCFGHAAMTFYLLTLKCYWASISVLQMFLRVHACVILWFQLQCQCAGCSVCRIKDLGQ